jgi:hypothetical protein
MDPTKAVTTTFERASDQLLNQGVLGTVVVLLLVAVVILWREVKQERDARIVEMKDTIGLAREMRETVETVVSAVKGRTR